MALSLGNIPSTKNSMTRIIKQLVFGLFFITVALVGFVLVGNDVKKENELIEDNTLELSLGGEVKYYAFPQGSTIHVIADENQNLIDIQVFTLVNNKPYLITPTNTKWQTSKPDN